MKFKILILLLLGSISAFGVEIRPALKALNYNNHIFINNVIENGVFTFDFQSREYNQQITYRFDSSCIEKFRVHIDGHTANPIFHSLQVQCGASETVPGKECLDASMSLDYEDGNSSKLFQFNVKKCGLKENFRGEKYR